MLLLGLTVILCVSRTLAVDSAKLAEAAFNQTRPGLRELLSWLPTIEEVLQFNGSSSECLRQTAELLRDAEMLKPRALHMLDSWAKYPSGVLRGNMNQLGDFDQCMSSQGCYCLTTLDVRLPAHLSSLDAQLHAHYAMKSTVYDPGHRLPKFSLVHWATCTPPACTTADIEQALSHATRGRGVTVEVRVDSDLCHCGDRPPLIPNRTTALTWYFFGFIIFLCFFGTAAEYKKRKLNPEENLTTKTHKLLEAFSLKGNLKTLVDTSASHSEIQSLHGIRALNALGLLLSHKQMAMLFLPFINRTSLAQVIGRAWSMLGRNAILYTDSFILLSGLLTGRSLLRELSRTNKINVADNIFCRYVRLTPSLLTLIMFSTLILPGLGSGPLWGLLVNKYSSLCQQYWWRNLLYIHNHFPFHEMCLTHSHQVGIDMQLFLIAPLLVYPLWKWPRKGLTLLFFVTVWSTLLRFYSAFSHQLSTIVYFGVPISQLFRTAEKTYILPTHRATVYCVGIALAYLLNYKNTCTMTKVQAVVGWVVGVSCGLLAMFGPYHMAWSSYIYSPLEAALYNALSPVIWSFFIAWVILACHYGYGGWFGKLLEWKWFRVFTRLSYAVYLTQFPIFFYNAGRVRTSQHYSIFTLIDLQELAFVMLASVVLTLLIDLPAQNLKKLFFSSSKKTTTEETFEQRNNNESTRIPMSASDETSNLTVPEQNIKSKHVHHRRRRLPG